jgi:hypothetical protein
MAEIGLDGVSVVAFIGELNPQALRSMWEYEKGEFRCAAHHLRNRFQRGVAVPLKKAANGFRVLHASRPVFGNDAGGVQLGGSGGTADDRPTARARMGDRVLCERL